MRGPFDREKRKSAALPETAEHAPLALLSFPLAPAEVRKCADLAEAYLMK